MLIRGGLLAVLGRGLDWARVMWRVPLPVVSMEGRSWQDIEQTRGNKSFLFAYLPVCFWCHRLAVPTRDH